MFSSDEIQIKVIVDDLETKEDKKLLLEAEIEIRFWNLFIEYIYWIRVLNTFNILSFVLFGIYWGVSDTFQKRPVEEEFNSEDKLEK